VDKDDEVEFVKESVVFEAVREHMLLDSTDEQFAAAMDEFITRVTNK
jgi:hypothetical protein